MALAQRPRPVPSRTPIVACPPCFNPFDSNPILRLPTEIWREIFALATRVPGGYDSSYISPFDFSDITDGYPAFLRRLSQNHRIKQTLCLVSRTWHAIAQELIFEYLFLQDGFDWYSLADGLESSRRNDDLYAGRGAGWYVRRLEICTFSWTPSLASAAARVIRCCPNLRVLTIGATDCPFSEERVDSYDDAEGVGVPLEVIRAVFETCPRALRALDWTCDLGHKQTHDMFLLLPKVKGLQSFFMCVQSKYIAPATTNILKQIRDVELANLHTLEIASPDSDPSGVLGVLAHWKLPKLRQVTLCGQQQLENGTPFFAAHGSRLSTLEFDYIGTDAETTLALCPNISELVVHLHFAHQQIRSGHPNVQKIGLRGLHLLEHSLNDRLLAIAALKSVFPIFLDRKRFPNVKLVRLLDYTQTRFSEQRWRSADVSVWAFWVKKFERQNVRLEDHEGNVLSMKFSNATVLLPEDIASGVYVPQ